MDVCQGPRLRTRKPHVQVPPLSCDCHAHVLGPQSQYPYVADRSFTPPDASSEAFVDMLDTLGIERMIVVQPSVYGSDNRRTAAAVAEIGVHRARGVAMVGSNVTVAEIEELDRAGIRATRFIATARGGPSLDELPAVAKAIAPFGWHIEMYVPPQLWDTLLPVVADLPVPVVFDHMGGIPANAGPDHPNLKKILQLLEKGRSWVKLTGYRNSIEGAPYRDVAALARLFVTHAPDRCVWGSDWPHTNMPDYMPDDGDLLDLLAEWVPDAETRRRVLVDNPAKLYRFA